MVHKTKDQWIQYINDELLEVERESYEDHLFECDDCMALYLEAVVSPNARLPQLTCDFTDNIMRKITSGEVQKKKRPIFEQTLFHYAVAAAFTIILMFSGAFEYLTKYVDDVQNTTLSHQNPSYTEQLVSQITDRRMGGEKINE